MLKIAPRPEEKKDGLKAALIFEIESSEGVPPPTKTESARSTACFASDASCTDVSPYPIAAKRCLAMTVYASRS